MTYYLVEEVQEAAEKMEIPVQLVPKNIASEVLDKLFDKYTSKAFRGTIPLWEKLVDDVSAYDPNAIKQIRKFSLSGEVLLLFGDERYPEGFHFDSFVDACDVLWECIGFVCYLTDYKQSYVVALNDHDMIIGCGKAQKEVIDCFHSK